MRRVFFITAILALLCTLSPIVLHSAKSEAKKPEEAKPFSALIVPAGVILQSGVGTVKAIRLVDKTKLAELESFFPNYRKLPKSDVAAGWMAGYDVYFDFPHGKAIRVTVSANDNGRTWSVGEGDFDTKGAFAGFVKKLAP